MLTFLTGEPALLHGYQLLAHCVLPPSVLPLCCCCSAITPIALAAIQALRQTACVRQIVLRGYAHASVSFLILLHYV